MTNQTEKERSDHEEALRRTEARLRLIIESARGYVIFTADAHGRINSWNAGAAQVLGWSEEEILGQLVDVTFTPEDRAAGVPQMELETARTRGSAPDVRWHLRKDGSRVFINGVSHAWREGESNGFFKIGRDETEQRLAEEALREHQEQLQLLNETLEHKVQEKTAEVHQLTLDLVKATQHERQRISNVLHDDLQQRLYAIKMRLAFLRDALPAGSGTAEQEASEIEKELREILKITRDLSIDLIPSILPGEGLSHALQWLVTRMREQYGLTVELRAEGHFVLASDEMRVFLFGCVRELLFNVVKHAGTSRAVVVLSRIDRGIQIEVRDHGKGFPDPMLGAQMSEMNEPPRSVGLPTMRHQLQLFGGSMEIHSKPGDETRVILFVPVMGEA